MDAEFSSRYADTGRPSIPPEQLLRALLADSTAWELVSFQRIGEAPSAVARLYPRLA